uniref:Si:dkey-16l2.20 n=1 Tax=Scleropages formosus TaxID=113540 RepID=A0A8C9VVH9_SCLFO
MSSNSTGAAVQTPDEEVPLDSDHHSGGRVKKYRLLAICSIICGVSCIGILSLVNSVKAQERRTKDPEKAQENSRLARKYGLLAIGLWVTIIVLTPLLMALLSYILRKIE